MLNKEEAMAEMRAVIASKGHPVENLVLFKEAKEELQEIIKLQKANPHQQNSKLLKIAEVIIETIISMEDGDQALLLLPQVTIYILLYPEDREASDLYKQYVLQFFCLAELPVVKQFSASQDESSASSLKSGFAFFATPKGKLVLSLGSVAGGVGLLVVGTLVLIGVSPLGAIALAGGLALLVLAAVMQCCCVPKDSAAPKCKAI